MASKYINAIVTPYRSVTLCEKAGRILLLNSPLTAVQGIIGEDGRAYLPEIHIVTDLTFLGAIEKTCYEENPIYSGKKINITIRLTRCSNDPQEQTFVDLDSFYIDLAQARENGELNWSPWEFYSYTRVTSIKEKTVWLPNLESGSPAYGAYALKVITCNDDDNIASSVQGIASLKVYKPPKA